MIHCKELNQDFETKDEMFRALKISEAKITGLKCSKIMKSAEKGQLSMKGAYMKQKSIEASKAEMGFEDGKVYPVINTTKYFDSHGDVHFDGLWKKTLKEQKGNIYYVDNHSFKVDDVIAWNEDVDAFTKEIEWNHVGKDFAGKTQALIFGIPESKIVKETAKAVIAEKRSVENSVRMQYVKITLGINSQEKELKTNKEYYDSRINQIANKATVEEQGYFWGVEEAKIHKEGSMVLAGSNDATSIIYTTSEADTKSLQDKAIEAAKAALHEKQNYLLNL
jgi:hypothetical protein